VAEFIGRAQADLADRLDVPLEEVILLRSESVEWRSSSLGCDLPDEAYVQVAVPGYRITLIVAEQRYEYHADAQRLISCASPTE